MKIVKAVPGVPIQLGRRGEYGVTQVEFDLRDFIDTFGPGTAELAASLPDTAGAYPVTITQKDATAVWEITAAWTASAGYGECQLSWYVGTSLARSVVYRTQVAESLLPEGKVPAPKPDYLDQMLKIGAEATQAASRAEESADDAETHAESAAASAEEAASYEALARNHMSSAEESRNTAEGYLSDALQAVQNADSARDTAVGNADAAVKAAGEAMSAATAAQASADLAESAQQKAEDAATAAKDDATAAKNDASRAATFASAAEESSKKNLVFVATCDLSTKTGTSYEELVEAYNAGKAIILRVGLNQYEFNRRDSSGNFLFVLTTQDTYYRPWCTTMGSWGGFDTRGAFRIADTALAALENRVTELEENGSASIDELVQATLNALPTWDGGVY